MAQKEKATVILCAFIFVIFYFIALMFFYGGENNLSPDSMDYYNIARNLASGKGFVQSIKWHFFNDDPVVHAAYAERPPLYPVMLSAIIGLGGSLRACIYTTMFLGALATGLFFLFLYDKTKKIAPAVIVTALIALNPNSIRCFSYLWTESLYFLLFVLTIMLIPFKYGAEMRFCKESDDESINGKECAGNACADSKKCPVLQKKNTSEISIIDIKLLFAGLFAALSYLARPSGMFLMAAVIIYLLWKKQFRKILMFSLFPALILGVWFLIVWKIKGSPAYSVQKYHAVVLNITDGMAAGFGRTFKSSFLSFFLSSPYAVFEALQNSFRGYATELFSGSFLSYSSWFLLLFPFIKMKRDGYIFLLLAAALNYVGHSMVWATHEGFRFMLFSFIPLLPIIVYSVYESRFKTTAVKQNKLFKIVFAFVLFILVYQYIWFNVMFYRTVHREKNMEQYYKSYIEYFSKNLKEDEVVSASDPFYVNYKTDKPAIILPTTLSEINISVYTELFDVKYFLVPPDYISVFSYAEKNKLLVRDKKAPNTPFIVYKVTDNQNSK